MIGKQLIRVQLRCRGTVQGVGFRPTVHRIATSIGLAGWVINDPLGATAEVEGSSEMIDLFVERLRSELPPLAHLDAIERVELDPVQAEGFEVRTSTTGRPEGALVPPDTVLCADCRREVEDPMDRRHHYPFTTCTNCGPRFSLVKSLPYDRERTSMACFPFCPDCEREYGDPADRRFHAEPVACPRCGPRLWLADENGEELITSEDPIVQAQQALLDGRIVAVKGLGGFQLACRADDPDVVNRLRRRKRRFGKPFAVMVRNLQVARSVVHLEEQSEALLASSRAPIVLAPRRQEAPISDEVAPGLDDLGVMIPTTPLHIELTRDPRLPPVVMTSANLSEEPLCRGNREAVERLTGIADLFLLHDRDIVRRVDDSVVRSSELGPILVRRARGWVPEPVPLPVSSLAVVVAVGGFLQVTGCVAQGNRAFPTQHVGDLESVPARQFHREVIEGLLDFLQATPDVVVADLHPDYPSSWYARELAETHGARLVQVQHHLAHIAAVLAESGNFPDPGKTALGIALDGTGWGPDETSWGGEWLEIQGDLSWRRLAHLEALDLIGGEAAVREPWRVAVAALVRSGHADLIAATPMANLVETARMDSVRRLAEDSGWPLASGAGRVFEAAGALLGVTESNRWEGEAAARLEALAAQAAGSAEVWSEVEIDMTSGDPVLPSKSLLAAAARRVVDGQDPSRVALGFHKTFSSLVVEITRRVSGESTDPVALGGGCLVNRILCSQLSAGFVAIGHEVLLPRQLPPGDGGLSYGQAVLAAVAEARGVTLKMEPAAG